jgi:lipoate-protein ligase A
LQRWWLPTSPAVVVGLGIWHRVADVLDLDRCRAAGVEVLQRRAGGGAVWLDEHTLCGAIRLPIEQVSADVTESYRWLGDLLALALGGRRVEVDEARADQTTLRAQASTLLATCYGALSPHEVVDSEGRKIVGLAQVRRRHAALFQMGVLLRDQSPLADFMHGPREELRAELRRRSAGINSTPQQVFEVLAAVLAKDATPFAP